MRKIFSVFVCLFVGSCLVGCDPVELTKRKVPSIIKDTLGSEPSRRGGASGQDAPPLTIISPKPDQVFEFGKEVTFIGQIAPNLQEKTEISWTVAREKAVPDDLGKGSQVKKLLPHGKYTAEAVVMKDGAKVTEKVPFRVAYMMPGKITLKDGAALAQTTVELIDESGKAVSKAQSSKDGSFSLEFPSDSEFKIVPQKEGFMFSPQSKKVKFARDASPTQFQALQGRVSDIAFVESPESSEPLDYMCPFQDVYLKLKIGLQTKPKRIGVEFVGGQKGAEREFAFDIPEADKGFATEPGAWSIFKVRAPAASKLGIVEPTYLVKVKVDDEEGHQYGAELRQPVKINIGACFATQMAKAIQLHEEKQFEPAERIYGQILELYNSVSDSTAFAKDKDHAAFNLGLAELQQALASEEGGPAHCHKAIREFDVVIKANSKDADALLFKGLAYQLLKKWKSAIEQYDKVTDLGSQSRAAHELRAQANLEEKSIPRLLNAIDDFTTCLGIDPNLESIREARKQALIILNQTGYRFDPKQEPKELDISKVNLRPVTEIVDLSKYLRK